jgi:hypothetical protein
VNLQRFSTLQLALGASIAVHAVLLTVRFVDPESFNRVFEDTPLEVILVNARSKDAPEMAQAPYGAQSRAYLQTRLRIGAPVTLLPQTVDRYGRTVAEVIGEVNLNLAMVEDGQAFAYRQYLSQCNAQEYLDAEFRASRSRYGVWRVPGGITRPWDFRRARRSGGGSRAVSPGVAPAGTAPAAIAGQRYRCKQIGSFAKAQELLRQGHTYLDGNGDGVACESLR